MRLATTASPRKLFQPAAAFITENIGSGAGTDTEDLGTTLRAITVASRLALADERSGIMADFARRIAAAQITAHPSQLGGIMRGLKAERRAALAIAARDKARERGGQRASAIDGKNAKRRPRRGRRDMRRPKNRHG